MLSPGSGHLSTNHETSAGSLDTASSAYVVTTQEIQVASKYWLCTLLLLQYIKCLPMIISLGFVWIHLHEIDKGKMS